MYHSSHIARSKMDRMLTAVMQFTNWKLIPHVIITIACLAPASTMMSYAPTLIKTYGYGRLRSNAMVSIGSWIALILYFTWGWLAYVIPTGTVHSKSLR
jgi:hypothetical protein